MKRKILAIDASSFYLKVMKSKLEADFNLITTTSPKKALKIILRKRPDIILLDFDMSEANGLELSEVLKADGRTAHIPIVLYTSEDKKNVIIRAYEIGVDAYMNKNTDIEVLIARLSSIIKNKETQFELYQNIKESYAKELEASKFEQRKIISQSLQRLKAVVLKFSRLKMIHSKSQINFDHVTHSNKSKDIFNH